MPIKTHLRVVIFREESAWIAQCLEHDICAQAGDINALRDRFLKTVECEIQDGNLDNIDPAPEKFFQMWDKSSSRKTGDSLPSVEYEFAMCA